MTASAQLQAATDEQALRVVFPSLRDNLHPGALIATITVSSLCFCLSTL